MNINPPGARPGRGGHGGLPRFLRGAIAHHRRDSPVLQNAPGFHGDFIGKIIHKWSSHGVFMRKKVGFDDDWWCMGVEWRFNDDFHDGS